MQVNYYKDLWWVIQQCESSGHSKKASLWVSQHFPTLRNNWWQFHQNVGYKTEPCSHRCSVARFPDSWGINQQIQSILHSPNCYLFSVKMFVSWINHFHQDVKIFHFTLSNTLFWPNLGSKLYNFYSRWLSLNWAQYYQWERWKT